MARQAATLAAKEAAAAAIAEMRKSRQKTGVSSGTFSYRTFTHKKPTPKGAVAGREGYGNAAATYAAEHSVHCDCVVCEGIPMSKRLKRRGGRRNLPRRQISAE